MRKTHAVLAMVVTFAVATFANSVEERDCWLIEDQAACASDRRCQFNQRCLPISWNGPPPVFLEHEQHPYVPFLGADSDEDLSRVLEAPARLSDDRAQKLLELTVERTAHHEVVVSWQSTPAHKQDSSDFIAVSCGPTQHLGDYLDMRRINGAQELSFKGLRNLGCHYSFHYVQHSRVLASTTTELHNILQPRGGRIALADAPDEMWVSFTTFHEDTPRVFYGTDRHNLDRNSTGTAETYTADMMCNAPANQTGQKWFWAPGYANHVRLVGLEAGTTVFYKFGTDKAGYSAVHSFTAPQLPGEANETRFIVYADMGVGPTAWTVGIGASHDASEYNHFLLHAGDISYARGSSWTWEAWFDQMERLSTKLPYMVSLGNHEYDHIGGGSKDPSGASGVGFHPAWGDMGDDSNGECSVPMFHRYRTPAGTGKELYWYSFNYGLVHVVMMSSEHDWTRGSEQYQWVEQDLASVNRTQTPWIVLTSHRMMYTTQLREDGDWKVSIQYRKEMDDLINQYKVNLMMSGHQHSYERSCPVYKEQCVADGKAPVHIIMGTAGAGLEHGGFSSQFGNWSLFHEEKHWGYTRLRASRDKLTVEYVATANSHLGQLEKRTVLDSVELSPWE